MKKVLIAFAVLALVACEQKTDSNNAEKANAEKAEEQVATPEVKAPEKPTGYNESGGFSTTGAEQKPISNMDHVELGDLVGFDIRPNKGIPYEGYYSLIKEGNEYIMHGAFMARSSSAETENGEPGRDVYYKGSYLNGELHDYWTEGVKMTTSEIEEDYTIMLHYDNGICQNATFKGRTHTNMKPTSTTFEGGEVCDFTLVRKKVDTAFQEEYRRNLKEKAAN